MTSREKYMTKSTSDLRHYLGQRGLGITPQDVAEFMGQQVSIHKLNKKELVDLLCRLDEANRGLADYIRPTT